MGVVERLVEDALVEIEPAQLPVHVETGVVQIRRRSGRLWAAERNAETSPCAGGSHTGLMSMNRSRPPVRRQLGQADRSIAAADSSSGLKLVGNMPNNLDEAMKDGA